MADGVAALSTDTYRAPKASLLELPCLVAEMLIDRAVS